ncbi:FAD-binding oxidoreductase [Hoeflea ulvae]|uniref:FAD-binding oxidoreductase n=1 Tax=Hoeflea ulvae TaxID=2983764 RepID=A0ABT3YC49_9HYPH|nr:FAD-binding oxidoreductase [Hoeflea ulvae]MCY0093453.1 FAD-binding oxidoreductase [Hoeflea ulvae]
MIHQTGPLDGQPAGKAGQGEFLARLAEICGPGNVLTGEDATGYGRDWRGQYPSQPLAVVRPASTDQVSAVLQLASASNIPVIPQGGNTGLVGGTQAEGGLVVSLARMNRIRSVDAKGRSAAVDAGVIVENLNTALAEYELRFPLMFGAQASAMIGGALSTNAGGANVLAHGMSRALCLGLEVVLPDGQVLDDMVDLRKNNTGFDLKQLFIGAEGTLGIITGAVLALTELPAAHAVALIATENFDAGLVVLNRLRRDFGNLVEAFEVMPRSYFDQMRRCDGPHASPLSGDPEVTILVELASSSPANCSLSADGSVPLVERLTYTLGACIEDGLMSDAVIAQTDQQRKDMWRLRELAPELSLDVRPVVAADVSVPLNAIGAFVSSPETILAAFDPDALIWMVGHLGDGNLHVVVSPSLKTAENMAHIRALIDAETVRCNGSFSAEHGIGVQKLATMAAHRNPLALDLMRRIKQAFDPLGIMNPGKVLPALQADGNHAVPRQDKPTDMTSSKGDKPKP